MKIYSYDEVKKDIEQHTNTTITLKTDEVPMSYLFLYSEIYKNDLEDTEEDEEERIRNFLHDVARVPVGTFIPDNAELIMYISDKQQTVYTLYNQKQIASPKTYKEIIDSLEFVNSDTVVLLDLSSKAVLVLSKNNVIH